MDQKLKSFPIKFSSVSCSNHLIVFPCIVWECAYFFLLLAPILNSISLGVPSILSVDRSTRSFTCFLTEKVELHLTCNLSTPKDYYVVSASFKVRVHPIWSRRWQYCMKYIACRLYCQSSITCQSSHCLDSCEMLQRSLVDDPLIKRANCKPGSFYGSNHGHIILNIFRSYTASVVLGLR